MQAGGINQDLDNIETLSFTLYRLFHTLFVRQHADAVPQYGDPSVRRSFPQYRGLP